MPQSGVGSMHGSNEERTHTRGDALTVLAIEWTHIGGDIPTM